MRRLRISCLPAAVSKNHWPSCFTSGIGNGQPSAPISSVALESELVISCVFSASRCTNMLYSSVAWTASGETKSCPSGPKIDAGHSCHHFVAAVDQSVPRLRPAKRKFVHRRPARYYRQRQQNQRGQNRPESGAKMKRMLSFIARQMYFGNHALENSASLSGLNCVRHRHRRR